MAVWDLNSNLDVFSMQTFLRGLIYFRFTEDNISELMKSKDSKSTQRAVTRSIKLFQDFLIQKHELILGINTRC
jgi:hypothetical protein